MSDIKISDIATYDYNERGYISMFVALEIGNAITKIVYGKKTKKSFAIKKYSIIKNSKDIVFPDGHINVDMLTTILKAQLKELNIRRADAYITLSSTSSIVRLREFPIVPIKQMREMLRYDAEQFLPYDVDAFAMDFRVNQIKINKNSDNELSSQTMEQFAEIMVVVHPKKLMEEQIKLAQNIKLTPKKITNYTEAIFSYFYQSILKEKSNILVVDIGAKNTRLTMFRGRQYFANSVSDIGIESIIEELVAVKDIKSDTVRQLLFNAKYAQKKAIKKAEPKPVSRLDRLSSKLKKDDGISSVSDSGVDPMLEHVYEQIAREMGRMIEFFKTRQFGYSVDGIYLIGGGANLNGIDTFLSKYHSIKVKKLSSPDSTIVPHSDYSLLIPSIGVILDQEVSL